MLHYILFVSTLYSLSLCLFLFLDIISRNLNGAEQIANRKCLMIEFYKILKDMEPRKEDLAAEILRNLTGKPKGKYIQLDFYAISSYIPL